MKITMNGKYAYRKDPYTQVRILCVDRPGHVSDPVCSMDPLTGFIRCHDKNGSHDTPSFDLVPLQEKFPDLWVNIYDCGLKYLHESPEAAREGLHLGNGKYADEGVKTIKYIPAPDQTS